MRILVTGGAGFIGSHIADALVGRGHEVVVFDDLSSGKRENVPSSARLIVADLRDQVAVERAVSEVRPEVIVHEAAQISVSVSAREPIRDAQINLLGSLYLLESARAHAVKRFVFASTGGAIYGEVPDGQRATVDWRPAPRSPYACSKLAFESYLGAYRLEHGLDARILRYANVYGPRQDPHGEAGVCAIFAERIVAGMPIQINARKESGDPGCVRDYVFVSDVVSATLAAVQGELSVPIANVASGRPVTTLELAQTMAKVSAKKLVVTYAARRAGDIERSVLEPDASLAKPTDLEEGLRQLLGA